MLPYTAFRVSAECFRHHPPTPCTSATLLLIPVSLLSLKNPVVPKIRNWFIGGLRTGEVGGAHTGHGAARESHLGGMVQTQRS